MSELLIFSFVVFAAYIAAAVLLFGVPASISDSFYLLEIRHRGLGYVFTLWCLVVALTVSAAMLEVSAGEWWQFLVLLAGGGLAFGGAAPLFKSHERVIHYVSAGVCAVAAVAWMAVCGYWYVPAAGLTACATVARRTGRTVFRIETALFLSMYIVLLLMTV